MAGGDGDAVGAELFGGDDEAAADGIERVGGESLAGVAEGGKAKAVGMGGRGGVGVHLVAAEEEVDGLVKGDGVPAEEAENAGRADLLDEGVNGGGMDGVGSLAGEAEEDGAVGGVADAGEGERAEELGLEAGGTGEEAGGGEGAGETKSGAHGADGV